MKCLLVCVWGKTVFTFILVLCCYNDVPEIIGLQREKGYFGLMVLVFPVQDWKDLLLWTPDRCDKWQWWGECGGENFSPHGQEVKRKKWPESYSPL